MIHRKSICGEIELIHNLSGRIRGSKKWESRPLDIDLLLYNDLVLDQQAGASAARGHIEVQLCVAAACRAGAGSLPPG